MCPQHKLRGESRPYSLSPVPRGEGWGEGLFCRATQPDERPLTLALSPEYRGEGTGAFRSGKWLLLIAIIAAIPHSAPADAGETLEQRQARSCKILAEARELAEQVKPAGDRTSALNSIGDCLARAGDITGALELDKKVETDDSPRPILKAVALAQYRGGHAEDALFTIHTMKETEAAAQTLIFLAESAEEVGDTETAVRFCQLVNGPCRLEALLLAARMQQAAADVEGSGRSLDAAKVLAHRQPDVAKVAETEALLGNLERAERLMARLRRESDQSRVMAAIVSVEAAAKDFENADAHAASIDTDALRFTALGKIALAHAELGQTAEAVRQINALQDDQARLEFGRSLTEMELKSHGEEAGRAVAAGWQDVRTKAVCMSIVALAAGKAGHADTAKKLMLDSQVFLWTEHDYAADPALAALAENLSLLDMPTEAMAMVERVKDSERRASSLQAVIRNTTRLHDDAAGRKCLESIREPREKIVGLIGIAEGILAGGN
jgi:tetratricopeptide (TPR) repeat protein